MINYEDHQDRINRGYEVWKRKQQSTYDDEAWRRKQPKCSCKHKHKVVVAIYKGEIEVLGISDPKHIEVTVLNLDEEHNE